MLAAVAPIKISLLRSTLLLRGTMHVVCRIIDIVGPSAVRGRSGAAAKFGEIAFKGAAPVRNRTNADL